MEKEKFNCYLCGSKSYEIREVCQEENILLGCYSYTCRTFHCLGCGHDHPKLQTISKQAFKERIEFLLLKNYPPSKFNYYTGEELQKKFPQVFNIQDGKLYSSNQSEFPVDIFHFKRGNQRFYLEKSIELYLKGKDGNMFNLSQPEDWTEGYKQERDADIEKYAPPSDKEYSYISVEEVLKREKSTWFWFDKRHLDFFTYNLLQPDGTRIYLEDSYDMYQRCYNGLINLKCFYDHDLEDL